MLVHTVHAENEDLESRAAARIQPGRHPGLPLPAEAKSRHCWDVRIVPPRCWASLAVAPQCYHTSHCSRDCPRGFFLPWLQLLPPCAACSGCSIQPCQDEPRHLLTGSRREEGQGHVPVLHSLLVYQYSCVSHSMS